MGKLIFLPNVPLTISTCINYTPSFEEDVQEYWRIQQLLNSNPKIKARSLAELYKIYKNYNEIFPYRPLVIPNNLIPQSLKSRIYKSILNLIEKIILKKKAENKMNNLISNKEFKYNKILKEMIKLESEGKVIPEKLRNEFWETIDDELKDENGRIKIKWSLYNYDR